MAAGRLRAVDSVSRCGDVRNGRATGSGRSDPGGRTLLCRSRMVTKTGQTTPTRIEGMRAIRSQDHQGTCSAPSSRRSGKDTSGVTYSQWGIDDGDGTQNPRKSLLLVKLVTYRSSHLHQSRRCALGLDLSLMQRPCLS